MSTSATKQCNDLVVGLGATGLSIARFLQRSNSSASFYDSRTDAPGSDELQQLLPEAEMLLGDIKLPAGISRVIASPGVPDSNTVMQQALTNDLEVISDIEMFVREAKRPIIAITGSNGKSTVTTLLFHMCVADGRKTLAGGNLGEPALDLLSYDDPDIYVLELSSFHLHRTQSLSAKVAVLLNISADHLDWHSSEAEYRADKYRIFHNAEAAIVSRADAASAGHAKACKRVISFGIDAPQEGHYGLRESDGERYLACGETLLLAVSDLAMYGVHNQLNALAALAAGDALGLDMGAMLQVLVEFPGLPHRMQFVARLGGVDFINDSKATNVAAAVASVESVNTMLVIIAGGISKGAEYADLAKAVDEKLRAAVLIGEEAEKIAAALDTVAPVHFADSMSAAVNLAAQSAQPEDTVLLAPACASFDQFDNYMERGDAFCTAVEALKR